MIALDRVYEVVKPLACLRKGGHIEWVEKDEDLFDDLRWYQVEGHGHHDSGWKESGS